MLVSWTGRQCDLPSRVILRACRSETSIGRHTRHDSRFVAYGDNSKVVWGWSDDGGCERVGMRYSVQEHVRFV